MKRGQKSMATKDCLWLSPVSWASTLNALLALELRILINLNADSG
jgi:hypothetical protein